MLTPQSSFDGEVVLITGAARGQGAAHAELLAARGASVVLLDGPNTINSVRYPMGTEEQLNDVAAKIRANGGQALAVRGDVRSQEDIDRAVDMGLSEFGRIDGLIANAGIWGEIVSLWEMSEETWADSIDIMLSGAWRSIKAVVPAMKEQGRGSIVIISSVRAMGEGMALGINYAAAKFGLTGVMMSAAMGLGPLNIRVNALAPGFIDTDMHRWPDSMDYMAGRPGGTEEDLVAAGRYYSQLKGRGPIDPLDVARSAAFLLSREADNLTGVIFPVDAGHTILPRVNQNPV
jgi:NAD(P)-dependent dehydrogenase (short-subunit alcohol dehydrogenase family)